MNKSIRTLMPAIATAAALATSPAWAQSGRGLPEPSPALQSVNPGEAVPLPEPQMSGEVQYVTGGVSYEELPAFRQARRDYPLNIEIYQKDGGKNAFTADAAVRVLEAKSGEVVLDAKAEGPYLWAKVPPGQYKVLTTLDGVVRESRVSVRGSGPTRAVVVFPE